jgi:hypothetical protein
VLRKKLTTLQAAIAVLSLNAAAMLAQLLVYSNKASCKKKVALAAAKKRYLSCASKSKLSFPHNHFLAR